MKTKMRFIRRFFSVLFIAGLLLACDKDGVEGPIGPQGPQGQQGEAGPQGSEGVDGEAQGVPGPQGANGADGADGVDGQAGADGQDGATGTANVIYSDWIVTEFPDNITSPGAGFDIDALDLTQNIMDRGTVLVYARNLTFSGFNYFALPFITGGDQHNFRIESEQVLRITVATLSGAVSSEVGNPFFEDYRYVIIPGGMPAATGPVISTKSEVLDYSKMSYEEIAEHFNIPD